MMPLLNALLRSGLRRAYRSALPISIRDQLALQRELATREQVARTIEPPAQRKVLVLAPHADDEVFGCGGTLARTAANGCEVRAVILTDGRKGYEPGRLVGADAQALRRFEDTLVQTRQSEARAASARLGLGPPQFLGLPDAGLSGSPIAPQMLAQALREWSPDVVFLPHFTDPHPDHHAALRLFLAAAACAGLPGSLACWGYEVWAPVVANAFVDITGVMPAKESAMQLYESQIRDVDYPRAIRGLNAFRSLGAGNAAGYAEAFFVESLASYQELFLRTWPAQKR
jgi:LmbE family N-acetylglucosaminyl deacetylase